jgi:1-aminocyclopropane-1-carboxylate deaminase
MYATNKSIEQCISIEKFNKRNIKLFMKRDDLIDLEVSGNKWRKLKYNIEHVLQHKLQGVLTFGGAYSNHLLATASACQKFNLKSIAIVRGEELEKESNWVLKRCAELGMQLIFVPRETYKLRNDYDYRNQLKLTYPGMYIIPEGGANFMGMIGCQEILMECQSKYDHIFVALGTGTTATGIASTISGDTKLNVVSALKGVDVIETLHALYRSYGFSDLDINDWLECIVPHENGHCGGYGKTSNELLEKIVDIQKTTSIELDPIYTGKVWIAMEDWIEKENITNSTILFIHTGGLLGGKEIMNAFRASKK